MDKKNPLKPGEGRNVPPEYCLVLIYFLEKQASEKEAKRFFSHYEGKRWLNNRGKLLSNWKSLAWEWIWKFK